MTARILTVLPLVLAACGGGSGGGPQTGSSVSAGADVDAATLEVVVIEASAPATAREWIWTQTAGPATDFGVSDAELTLTTPAFPSTVELQVEARNAAGETLGSDRVIVRVTAQAAAPTLGQLSAITVNGGGADRLTGAALHAASQRLFVVDGAAAEVVVYDVSNPSSPSFAGVVAPPLEVPGYVPGPPLAVGCGDEGAVAITWADDLDDLPGRLQLVDATTLVELRTVSTTGSQPIDIDVTPDGSMVAIACAGDRVRTTQGHTRGYVTFFDTTNEDVAPIPFSLFDGTEALLEADGVRFLDPFRLHGPEASLDLVPSAVALADDGSRAWVTCAQNDCVLTIDVTAQLVTGLAPLPDRVSGSYERGASLTGITIEWDAPPAIGTTAAGDTVFLGGIEGIAATWQNSIGLGLRTLDGSGPTLEPVDLDGDGEKELPFAFPSAGLRIRNLLVQPGGGVGLSGEIELRDASGAPVLGLPEAYPSAPGLAGHDELAVDLFGQPVVAPGLGANFTGGTVDGSGDYWLADARRAALWHFGSDGVLIERFTPQGTAAGLGTPSLPAAFARRRVDLDFEEGRRFGGLGSAVFLPTRGTVLALARLPLHAADGTGSAESRIVRAVEVDAATGAVVGEYALVLEATDHAVEALTHSPAGHDWEGETLLLEAANGVGGARAVFRIDLDGATNLRSLGAADYAAIDAVLESTDPGDLDELTPAITPIGKRLAVDLAASGADTGPRPTTLAFSFEGLFVAQADGYLGLSETGFDPATGALRNRPTGRTGAAHWVRPSGLVFDTSVDGEGAASSEWVPAVGLDQPRDAVAIGTGDGALVLLANGGAPRIIRDANGAIDVDERVAANTLTLDSSIFPDAASWQPEPFGGDLLVSSHDADLDGDGITERLALFGSRSVSMIDASGETIWTSNRSLVDWSRATRPERVDAASELSGIEPAALTAVDVAGAPMLLTALRGAGLVALHDLTVPRLPRLVGLAGSASDPVDVDAYATGANALVAVTDRGAGVVRLYRLQR